MTQQNSIFYQNNKLILLFMSILIASLQWGCSRSKNADYLVESQTYGLALNIIDGDNQVSLPGKLFAKPLTIQVTNIAGEPVSGLYVYFTLDVGSSFYITPTVVKTNSSGYASVDVRGPEGFNEHGEIGVTLEGTSLYKTFVLDTNDQTPGIHFEIETTTGNTVIAGQPVGFVTRLVDSNGTNYDFTGSMDTQWTIITKPSWAGTAPQNVLTRHTCSFVHGECTTPENIVFTDSSQITTIDMGDGPTGYHDVFAYELTILSDIPTKVTLADKLGGPAASAKSYGTGDIRVTTDSKPENVLTFAAAIVDNSGNYIQDAPSASWSSNSPYISNYLTATSGNYTSLTPEKTIPHPNFGNLYVMVPNYPAIMSNNITIDPGELHHLIVLPTDGVTTRDAGVPFSLVIQAVDSKDNVVGQNYTGPGFNLQNNLHFEVSNYQKGTVPAAGDVPWFGSTLSLSQQTQGIPGQYPSHPNTSIINRYLLHNFSFGVNNDVSAYSFIFFDSTDTDPNVPLMPEIKVTTTAVTTFKSVTGTLTLTMNKGQPHHIMLRNGAGPEATPLCVAGQQTFPMNQYNSIWTMVSVRSTLPSAMQGNKLSCKNMNFMVGTDYDNLYYTIEDIAGNFLANIQGEVTGYPGTSCGSFCTTDWTGSMTPETLAPFTKFNYPTAQAGSIKISGTYNGNTYESELAGVVTASAFDHYDIVLHAAPAVSGVVVTGNNLNADTTYYVYAYLYDQYNNNISVGGLTSVMDIHTTSSSGSFPASPIGTSATVLNLVQSTFQATNPYGFNRLLLGGVKFPNVNTGTVTFTISNDTSTTHAQGPTVSKSFVVKAGTIQKVQLRTGTGATGGALIGASDIGPQPLNMTTDDSPTFYLSGFDMEGNYASGVTGNWTLDTLNPSNAVSISPNSSQNFFLLTKPFTANFLEVVVPRNYTSSLVITTGSINVTTGNFHHIEVVLPSTPPIIVSAGSTIYATLNLQDADNNILDITGNVNLDFSTLGSTSTRSGVGASIPIDGNYWFDHGTRTNVPFSFYNSLNTAAQMTVTGVIGAYTGSGYSGAGNVLVTRKELYRIRGYSSNAAIYAGDTTNYEIVAEDIYGNQIRTGDVGADLSVKVQLTNSTLDPRQDFKQNNLVNGSDVTSGTFDVSLTGDLADGTGTISMSGTKSGNMTVSGTVTSGHTVSAGSYALQSVWVNPRDTISGLTWSATTPNTVNASPINPFAVELQLVDLYGNIITGNSIDQVRMNIVSPTYPRFYESGALTTGTYTSQVFNGKATFTNLYYTKVGNLVLKGTLVSNGTITTGGYYSEPDRSISVTHGTAYNTIVLINNQIGAFTEATGDINTAFKNTNPFSFGDGKTVSAGTTLNVQVRLVDESFNTRTNVYLNTVSLDTVNYADPYQNVTNGTYDVPGNVGTLYGGVADFKVQVRSQGTNHRLEANNFVSNYNSIKSSGIDVNPGGVTKLITVLPGQYLGEGANNFSEAVTYPIPTTGTAGVPFYVNVFAVDNYYNRITSTPSRSISLTTSDINDTHPSALTMNNGWAQFSVTNITSGTNLFITATDGLGTLTAGTSSYYDLVGNTPTQCLAIFSPDQTFSPGKMSYGTAVSGSIGAKTACNNYFVKAYAVDQWFNISPNYTGALTLTTPDDPTSQLPTNPTNFTSGTAQFSLKTVTAKNSQRLVLTCPTLTTAGTTPMFNVNVGSAAQVVTYFPVKQTFDFSSGHNSLSGALTTPSSPIVAGVSTSIIAVVTDTCFNRVTSSSPTVNITSSNPSKNPSSPINLTLTSGSGSSSITYYYSGSGYSISSVPTTGTMTYPTTNYDVSQNTGSQLLVRLPGQSFSPGQSNYSLSITGTPFHQTDGYPYNIIVYATDVHGNVVNDNITSITLNPSSGSFSSMSPITLSNGTAMFTVDHPTAIASLTDSANVSSGTAYSPVASSSYQVFATHTNPTFTTLADPITGNTTYLKSSSVNATVSTGTTTSVYCITETAARPSGAGANAIQNCVGNVGAGNAPSASYNNKTGWTLNSTSPNALTFSGGQGPKTFYFWTSDPALNVSTATLSRTITVDSIAPTTPTVTLISTATTAGTFFTTSNSVSLTVSNDTDSGSGLGEYCMYETSSAVAPTPTWTPGGCLSGSGWSGTAPTAAMMGAQGKRYIYVYTKDNAMNISSAGSSSIVYDSVAPTSGTIQGVTGTGDATKDVYLGGTSLNPTINWSAVSDTTSLVTYDISIRTNPGGVLVCSDSILGAASTSKSVTSCSPVLVDSNNYNLTVVARDQANNTTTLVSDPYNFMVDNTYPLAPTITGLVSEATYNTLRYVSTVSPQVSWDLSLSGDVANYIVKLTDNAGVQLNTGGCSTANSAATVSNSTQTHTFSSCTLTNGTAYRAYVTAVDVAGNATTSTNYNFIVSTVANSFALSTPVPVAGTPVTVTLSALKPDGNVDTAYTGNHTVTLTSTGGAGYNLCNYDYLQPTPTAIPVAFAPTSGSSLNFAAGVSSFDVTFRKVETGRSITATEVGGNVITGTAGSISVASGAEACKKIIDITTTPALTNFMNGRTVTLAMNATKTLYPAMFDASGNFLGISASTLNWSGTYSIDSTMAPTTGTYTTVYSVTSDYHAVDTSGANQPSVLSASGTSDTVTFSITTPTSLSWTYTSTDASSNKYLTSGTNSKVYFYDTAKDSSSAWRTAGTQSWYSESFVANTRGSRAEFPKQVFIVASKPTPLGLDIIDATTNKLWMRFNAGTNYALENLGTIKDIVALEGRVYLGVNNNNTDGLMIVIDFKNDAAYEVTTTTRKFSTTLASRNSAQSWVGDTTLFGNFINDAIHSLDAKRIGGADYVAIGTQQNNVYLLKAGTTSYYRDTSVANPVSAVALSSNSLLYYAEEKVGLHRADLSLPLSADFASTFTYSRTSTPMFVAVPSNTPTAIVGLSVAENTATVAAGNHTVMAATTYGLITIQENTSNNASAQINNLTNLVTTAGTIAPSAASMNGALHLDGSAYGYATVAGSGSVSNIATLELWFKPESNLSSTSGTAHLALRGTYGSDNSYGLMFNRDGDGKISFWVQKSGTVYQAKTTATSWTKGTWYSLAGTMNGASGIKLYLYGNSQASATPSNPDLSTGFDGDDGTLYIGGNGTNNFYGAIDELKLANTLTRSANYGPPTGSSQLTTSGGAIYLFHFDQYSGSTATNTVAGVNGSLGAGAWLAGMLYNGTGWSVLSVKGDAYTTMAIGELITDYGLTELTSLEFIGGQNPTKNLSVSITNAKDALFYHSNNESNTVARKDLLITTGTSLYLYRK